MIGGWFKNTWLHYQEHKVQEKMIRRITEQVVDVADPYIRQAKRYRTVLRDPVTRSMQYCTSIVDAVPGPVELSRKGYHANPLVKALFASPDELEEMVSISPEVQAFKKKGTEGDVLKGVKKILGGKNHMMEMFAAPDPEKRGEYRKAKKKLVEVEQELDKVREQIATPEHSLGYLESIMKNPGNSLMMQSLSFRLDWKGVRVDDMPESEGNDITLAEFSVGEDLRRSAVLVTFSLGSGE